MWPAAYNVHNVLATGNNNFTTTRTTAINMTTTAAATTINGNTLKLNLINLVSSCGFHRKTYQ
jgi:hypothetical protein